MEHPGLHRIFRATQVAEEGMGIARSLNDAYPFMVCWWFRDLTQARAMATKLCAIAAPPPERIYLALGHRLLAEIAIAERRWERAEAEVAQAMSAMNGPPTPSAVWHAYAIATPERSSPIDGSALPLAAWRVHATAAKLRERQGRPSEAEGFRQQSRTVIQQLADSLDASDPLRGSLIAGHERVSVSMG